MFTSASSPTLREIAENLQEISKDLLLDSSLLDGSEERCKCCNLNVKNNFQEFIWKKSISQAAKRLSQISGEINSSLTTP